MSKLNAKKRAALPASDFAIPSKRAFPIFDKQHAINAEARATQSGDPAVKAQVYAAVARKYPDLGKEKKKAK